MDVVTAAMGSLLPKLGELLVGEYNLQTGVKEDVEFLEREMRSMNAALIKVAKVPRDQLDNQVIVWADELRDLSYDMRMWSTTSWCASRDLNPSPMPSGTSRTAPKRWLTGVTDTRSMMLLANTRLTFVWWLCTRIIKRSSALKMHGTS